MSERLAACLTSLGHLKDATVNAALGRQMIYGGSLDTVLLEMRVIDEATLWKALGTATGLPLPPEGLMESPSVEAGALFDSARAERCAAAPVAFDGKTLKLLAADPVQHQALAEAARDLGCEIELFVVPEVRLFAVRDALYNRPMSPRYLALLSRLVGAEPVRRWQSGKRSDAPELAAAETPAQAAAAGTSEIPTFAPEPVTAAMPAPTGPRVREFAPPPSSPPAKPKRRTTGRAGRSTKPGTAGATPPSAPTSDEVTFHRLAGAESRDEVFDALAEGAAARMSFVVVLSVGVHEGQRVAQGRVARAGARRDVDRVARLTVPLDPPSPFKTVVETALPYVGSPGSTDVARDFLDAIRRSGMPEIILVPVVMRRRVVCLLYADRAGAFALDNDTGHLTVYASAAGKAMEALILRNKAASFAHTQMEGDAPEFEGDRPTEIDVPPGWEQPTPPPGAETSPAIRKASPTLAGTEIDALLDAYEADPSGPVGSAAGSAILRRGDVNAVLQRLARWVASGKSHKAAEEPLLRLLVMFGDPALPVVRPLLEHADPAWRRRGAEMLVTLTAHGSEETLCRLATDPDATVRTAALRALRTRASHPQVIELQGRLRGQLESGTPSTAAAAAAALGELRDRDAVGSLIDKLKSPTPAVALAAHRALLEIAKQDFGMSRWRWSTWWKKARDRNRIEWLFEGLAHRSPEIRFSASEELKQMTGEYFGYHFDLPRRDREEARRRWMTWWSNRGADRAAAFFEPPSQAAGPQHGPGAP